ncbi:uncharacterized protein LOC116806031 [Drosophila grimshawi]|uniref:uncharacterized protein LOC116806031 n=1 Tax=Drosophila grimshawi TaxID=7222 RepID=UPI000C8713C2|nr:uncharacterized protein LOC116806031 [Drosophila grimshawi]
MDFYDSEDGAGDDKKANMEEEEKPLPSWVEWCERNAQPKRRCIKVVEPELTRWRKPGPMKKKDWKKFFQWAMNKAMPKELKVVPPEPLPCNSKYLPCGRPKRKIPMEDLIEKMEALSKPLERKMTPKHEYERPFYAYSPVIVWGKPPRHDKGRPFPGPFFPCCFANKEVQDDFWATLRFPVRPSALTARPTARILSLARPHIMPPNPPHCPIPAKIPGPLEVPPPKRKKFTTRGWRLHQIRLIYLSKPVSRPEFEYFYM